MIITGIMPGGANNTMIVVPTMSYHQQFSETKYMNISPHHVLLLRLRSTETDA